MLHVDFANGSETNSQGSSTSGKRKNKKQKTRKDVWQLCNIDRSNLRIVFKHLNT